MIRIRSCRTVFMAIMTLLAPALLLAQDPVVKRTKYSVECPTCRVDLTKIATLGKRSDPSTISIYSGLARDSKGRFFAFSDERQLLVFDSVGNFLKAIGRKGDGPGEFAGKSKFPPLFAVGRGDSIFVVDPPRISVFSSALIFARTIDVSVSPQLSFFPLRDGHILLAAESRLPNNIGRGIHVLGGDGNIMRSLGPEERVTPRQPTSVHHFFLSPNQASFWFGTGFSFDQWSLNNKHLSRLEIVNVPFLPTPTSVVLPSGRGVAQSNVGAAALIGVDTVGQLWVFGRTSGDVAQLRRAATPIGNGGLLEIVDAHSGTIKSSQRVGFPLALLARGDLAYSPNMDSDMFFTISIWRYRFVR